MKKTVLILTLSAGTLFAQSTNEDPVIVTNDSPAAVTDIPLIDTNESPAIATNAGPVLIPIDGYAARVGKTIITWGEIRESVAPLMLQLTQRFQGAELDAQFHKAMVDGREALIDEALMKEEIKLQGLSLPDHIVEKETSRLIRERFDNDIAKLKKGLVARRMTYEEWRTEVGAQLALQVYYNREVSRHVSVSEEDIQAAYDQIKENYTIPLKTKFRVILLNKGTSEEDRAVKKEQAEHILQKLRAGADFAETAKEFSEGIRASDGGAFPWKEPKEVNEALRPALRTLPAGQISDLIETDDVYYIVKVEERREEGYVPIEELYDQIEAQLLDIDQARLHRRLIERLSGKHYVVRY